MPSVVPMDNLLGASLSGVVVSAVIYGITCVQTYLYYTKYSTTDLFAMKFMVAALCLHLALVTMMVYHYTISNWGDVIALSRTTWTLEVQIVVGGLLTLIVQCFFAHRIWRFSKNWALTGIIVLLSLLGLGFGVAFMVHGFQTQFFAIKGSKANSFLTATFLSGDIACDTLITLSMCYYLHKSRTGLKGTDTMINLLITYAIRTCLVTTVCTTLCLVTFNALPRDMIYQPFYFIGCRLYANSLLSMLNARETIRDKGQPQDSGVFSLPRFAVGASSTNDSSMTDKQLPADASHGSLDVFTDHKDKLVPV
ncbi:hypothetical protein PILCRDRAFT_488674 [Piloderma croceum F 1598]|uniref:DUF6534 domain-containing protein n=1 Tax=Piloderma croceum (strain F 1598) TaxID=765440 RepID=A0A0C3FRJ5_PILCF|nr:hypothetical protein PILCRDRAFT_488674 [Piloderma croceum F 1598]